MKSDQAGMTLRPYQLLEVVGVVGDDAPAAGDQRARAILEAVRQAPDRPLTLRCNAGDAFAYQDPGPAADTPGSAEFNMKRDLEILHKLNLAPGSTLPARIIFHRLLDRIEDLTGICRFDSVTADAWEGCSAIDAERYRKGRARGIAAIIPPRAEAEMRRDKEESLRAMYAAAAVRVRPHILLCSLCQYGGGTRPPYPEDNLPELVELLLRQPDLRITLAPQADWLMCAPCPYRAAGLNACVNNKGSGGLPNQLRDLRVLQRLGLRYGSTRNARDLYRLICARIPGTLEICRLDHAAPSVWHTGCGAATVDREDYARGRQLLLERLVEMDQGSIHPSEATGGSP